MAIACSVGAIRGGRMGEPEGGRPLGPSLGGHTWGQGGLLGGGSREGAKNRGPEMSQKKENICPDWENY